MGNEASGPTYSTVRLCQSLATINNEVVLLTVKDGDLKLSENFVHRVFPKAKFLSRLWRSPELYRAIVEESKSADVLHSHSLWVMPNIYPGWVSKKISIPLVLSPRGTLAARALSHSNFQKKIFWKLFQEDVVKRVTCLHATSEEEYLDIRRMGLKQPVCIIPNGIDIPERMTKEQLYSTVKSDSKTLLYLGRLHPIKGIDILIQAWSEIAVTRPDWQLRIVGPGSEGYTKVLKGLVSKLEAPRIEFVGAVFGKEKQLEYQRADVFILPSHSENFGMTVAEALANGTPVIATKNTPWNGLVQNDCGWWIDLTLDQLKSTLSEVTAIETPVLNSMGEKGRYWVSEQYDWTVIASQMNDVYHWLISGGPPPESVVLD